MKKDISEQVKKDIEEITSNFAEKIKLQRSKLNISMADLYKLSGVSSSTINDIEKSRYLPHLEVMLKLGYSLDLSFSEVISLLTLKSSKSKEEKRQYSQSAVKALLRNADFNEKTIKEIMDFIEFKAKNREINPYK
ncbi:helix-turn-helix transcriptional regulator [bacterium]|nr:helix-turn-helix transcriptional regulator [bacterium]